MSRPPVLTRRCCRLVTDQCISALASSRLKAVPRWGLRLVADPPSEHPHTEVISPVTRIPRMRIQPNDTDADPVGDHIQDAEIVDTHARFTPTQPRPIDFVSLTHSLSSSGSPPDDRPMSGLWIPLDREVKESGSQPDRIRSYCMQRHVTVPPATSPGMCSADL
jgi:hypothetical protein